MSKMKDKEIDVETKISEKSKEAAPKKKVTRKKNVKKTKTENPKKMLQIFGRNIWVEFLPEEAQTTDAQKIIDKDVLGAVCYKNRAILAHSHFAFQILRTLKVKDLIVFDGIDYIVTEVGNESLLDKEADYTLATCDFTNDNIKRHFNIVRK